MRNLKGSFSGTFERQMEGFGNGASIINLIRAYFLDPDYVRSLSLGGQSGTAVKEDQGSHDLASEYGAHMAFFKA